MPVTLDTLTQYSGPIFRVSEELIEDGERRYRRDVVRKPACVAVLALDPENPEHVLLTRQYRHPTGQFLLEAMAGSIDPGEEPEAAAQRELAEELGYRAGRLIPLFTAYSSPGWTDEQIHLFLAEELVRVPQPAADDTGLIEVVSLSLEELCSRYDAGQLPDMKTLLLLCLAGTYLTRRENTPQEEAA